MPIYEYACEACGHAFEALQKVSDGPLKKCPECGKPRLKKLVSAPSFRLKGGGWYETDFKSGKKKNLADAGDKPATKDKDTETKPAKAEPKPKADPKPKPESKPKAPTT